MNTPLELAYLAGFIDGEGYIGINQNRGLSTIRHSHRSSVTAAREAPTFQARVRILASVPTACSKVEMHELATLTCEGSIPFMPSIM